MPESVSVHDSGASVVEVGCSVVVSAAVVLEAGLAFTAPLVFVVVRGEDGIRDEDELMRIVGADLGLHPTPGM